MTTVPPFSEQLAAAVRRKQTPALVGLDPRLDSLPDSLRPTETTSLKIAQAYRDFCYAIIDVVAPLVPAVKPQAAFFEQLGPEGYTALAEVVAYAKQAGLLVILDAKRGDIGSTAEAYADGHLGAQHRSWTAHALTVNPYLGRDTLEPFVAIAQQRQAGLFVLVKTSNPGSGMIQDLDAEGQAVYQHVARCVEQLADATRGSGDYGCVGAVVGATYPQQLIALRAAMPHAWILVPGYGSQGGTARDAVQALDSNGLGALVNSSRNIIFAHRRSEYAELAARDWRRAVEQATRDMIIDLKSAADDVAEGA